MPLFIRWLGFSVGFVDVAHAERFAGKTSYTLYKLLKLSAESIISQSNKPLHLSIALGLLLALGAFLVALYFVAKYFLFGIPVTGFTSMMVSLWMLGGILLANLGILGLYLEASSTKSKTAPFTSSDSGWEPSSPPRKPGTRMTINVCEWDSRFGYPVAALTLEPSNAHLERVHAAIQDATRTGIRLLYLFLPMPDHTLREPLKMGLPLRRPESRIYQPVAPPPQPNTGPPIFPCAKHPATR